MSPIAEETVRGAGRRQPIRRVEGTVAPLPVDNVDTDQIIPAEYLKVTDRSGLAEGLFAHWRYRDADPRRPDPEFVLNRSEHSSATILLAGDNFGCGSSREHAPWALLGHGFRAVISTRFADIFRNNSLKNGLLVVEVPEEVQADLFRRVAEDPGLRLGVDLVHQRLELLDGSHHPFQIDAFARTCMIEGVDQLGYLLDRLPQVERWEGAHPPRLDTRSAL